MLTFTIGKTEPQQAAVVAQKPQDESGTGAKVVAVVVVYAAIAAVAWWMKTTSVQKAQAQAYAKEKAEADAQAQARADDNDPAKLLDKKDVLLAQAKEVDEKILYLAWKAERLAGRVADVVAQHNGSANGKSARAT